jgi:hypothetical protein
VDSITTRRPLASHSSDRWILAGEGRTSTDSQTPDLIDLESLSSSAPSDASTETWNSWSTRHAAQRVRREHFQDEGHDDFVYIGDYEDDPAGEGEDDGIGGGDDGVVDGDDGILGGDDSTMNGEAIGQNPAICGGIDDDGTNITPQTGTAVVLANGQQVQGGRRGEREASGGEENAVLPARNPLQFWHRIAELTSARRDRSNQG